MLDQLIIHLIDRLDGIRLDGELVPVNGPTPEDPEAADTPRDFGEPEYPHLGVSVPTEILDQVRHRDGFEEATPVGSQTLTLAETYRDHCFAAACGTKDGPFEIVAGVNDQMLWRVMRGDHVSENELVKLLPGNREAWEIVREINGRAPWETGIAKAGVNGERLRIEALKAGDDLVLRDVANSAYATLGLEARTYSALEVTGPEKYQIRPYPLPWRVLVQVDVRSSWKKQRRVLVQTVMDLLDGWCVEIDGYTVEFDTPEDPVNADEISEALYRSVIRCWVTGIWSQRQGEYEVPAVRSIATDLSV